MSLALLLLALAQQPAAPAPGAQPATSPAGAQQRAAHERGAQDLAPTLRAEAQVEASAEAFEVGQPFTLTLLVRHAADDPPSLDAAALEADPSWAVLGGGEPTRLPDPRDATEALTRATWQVVSLEAGERELPAPKVLLPVPGGVPTPLEVARAKVTFRGVLAPGEDEPRPPGGFLGLGPEPRVGPWRRALPWGIAALLVAGAAAVWLVRRRRQTAAPPAPTALERLAALEAADLARPEAVRAVHHELTHLLREAVDARLGSSPPGLTDREWIVRLEQRLGAQRAERYAELIEACEPVKYGAEQPTHWAARERITRARELAAEVGAFAPPVEAVT